LTSFWSGSRPLRSGVLPPRFRTTPAADVGIQAASP
jgi:hypothetical protein